MIGKPTHYRIGLSSTNQTACGLVGASRMARAAYDPRDVDCINCRNTRRWRTAMGKPDLRATPDHQLSDR